MEGASAGLEAKSIMKDLGLVVTELMAPKSDATAATALANRAGADRVRNVEGSELWTQQQVCTGNVCIEKVHGTKSIADAISKAADGKALKERISAICALMDYS